MAFHSPRVIPNLLMRVGSFVTRPCRFLQESWSRSGVVYWDASGTETSLRELAAALLKVMGSRLAPEYRADRKINSVTRRLADVRKAERVLGFRAQVGLDEGLSRLVEWWRVSRTMVAQA